MKINLTIAERMHLLQLLPNTGNYRQLKMSAGITDKVKFEEDEVKFLKLTESPKGIQIPHDVRKNEYEYDFSQEEETLIRRILLKLNEENQLQFSLLGLFEKFIEGYSGGYSTEEADVSLDIEVELEPQEEAVEVPEIITKAFEKK